MIGSDLKWLVIVVIILFYWNHDFIVFFTMTNRISVSLLRVTDGDTIRVEEKANPLKKHSVRFAYIDAPEMAQTFGRQARMELADKLKYNDDLSLEIVPSKDRYGRTLAVVYIGNENINMWLVKKGYAWAYEKYAPQEYVQEQALAKKKKLGLWSSQEPEAPWQMRKRKRTQVKRPQTDKPKKNKKLSENKIVKLKGKIKKPKKEDVSVKLKKRKLNVADKSMHSTKTVKKSTQKIQKPEKEDTYCIIM